MLSLPLSLCSFSLSPSHKHKHAHTRMTHTHAQQNTGSLEGLRNRSTPVIDDCVTKDRPLSLPLSFSILTRPLCRCLVLSLTHANHITPPLTFEKFDHSLSRSRLPFSNIPRCLVTSLFLCLVLHVPLSQTEARTQKHAQQNTPQQGKCLRDGRPSWQGGAQGRREC